MAGSWRRDWTPDGKQEGKRLCGWKRKKWRGWSVSLEGNEEMRWREHGGMSRGDKHMLDLHHRYHHHLHLHHRSSVKDCIQLHRNNLNSCHLPLNPQLVLSLPPSLRILHNVPTNDRPHQLRKMGTTHPLPHPAPLRCAAKTKRGETKDRLVHSPPSEQRTKGNFSLLSKKLHLHLDLHLSRRISRPLLYRSYRQPRQDQSLIHLRRWPTLLWRVCHLRPFLPGSCGNLKTISLTTKRMSTLSWVIRR